MSKRNLIIIAVIFLIIDCALIAFKLNQHHKPKPIHKLKPNYKYSVYLTADDGPLVGSKNLNQLIIDYEVPVSLFLVARNIVADTNLKPNFMAYTKNPYVLISNHSYAHANGHYKRFYKNSDAVVADFIKSEETLNITSHIARLPGRNTWVLNDNIQKGKPNSLEAAKKLYSEHNYKTFGWDYELRHDRHGKILKTAMQHYKKIKELLKEGKTFTKNQIVVLMHDQMFTNSKSEKELGELILLLQDDDECKLKLINKYKE